MPMTASNGDAPAVDGRCLLHTLLVTLSVVAFTDLVADQSTDRRAAYRSDRAAAREDSTADRTYAGADCRVLVSRRHPATTAQAEQHCHGNRTNCKPIHRFNLNASWSNFGLSIHIRLPNSFRFRKSAIARQDA